MFPCVIQIQCCVQQQMHSTILYTLGTMTGMMCLQLAFSCVFYIVKRHEPSGWFFNFDTHALNHHRDLNVTGEKSQARWMINISNVTTCRSGESCSILGTDTLHSIWREGTTMTPMTMGVTCQQVEPRPATHPRAKTSNSPEDQDPLYNHPHNDGTN